MVDHVGNEILFFLYIFTIELERVKNIGELLYVGHLLDNWDFFFDLLVWFDMIQILYMFYTMPDLSER